MVLQEGSLEHDEDAYLREHSHSFKGLLGSTSHKPKSFEFTTNFQRAWQCTLPVVSVFLASMSTFLVWRWLAVVCVLAVTYVIGSLAFSLFVLLLSVLVGKIHQNHHERSVIYWSFFPCWKFILCCTAAILGGFTGHYLWETCWQQYSEVSRLKIYKDIDTALTPGQQIMDAGAVDFARGTGIDTEHAGCFMNAGTTYCVAPIVANGEVKHSLGAAPAMGSYDYFAVGVNCCSCPDMEFRCGAWMNPSAEGGIRSTDLEARPFFKLAVDAWSSSYRKASKHPLFFEWVESPVSYWASLRHRFYKLLAAAIFLPALVVFGFAMTLARVLKAMLVHGWASSRETPAPPEGFEQAWARFLPEMYERQKKDSIRRAKAAAATGYGTANPEQPI